MSHTVSYDFLLKEYNSGLHKYNTLIDTSPDGIIILNAIRNEEGDIVDFEIADCNRAGTILGHFPPDARSKSLLTVLPHLKNSDQFYMHRHVADSGIPIQFETNFHDKDGKQYGWFIVSLMRLEDGVLSRFIDISEKKLNEQKIEAQAAFYNGILEASINGIFVCEAVSNQQGIIKDFTIIKVNKAFIELTKKSPAEVEGKSYFSVFPQPDNVMFGMYCDVINTGVAIRRDFEYPPGSGIWYDLSIGKLNNNTIVITFTDITENKKTFSEIERQNNLLTSIFANSPSGISVTKVLRNKEGIITDGKTILANEISAVYTGMSKDSFQQKTFKEIEPRIADTELFKRAVETIVSGHSFRMQVPYKSTGRWLEISVSKMDDNHLVNIFSDVTDIKESQLKLEKLVDELKRTNTNLEEFTYAASHDLKEPIRKIRIFVERLKINHSASLNEEGLMILEKLLTSSLRMRLLVDDLLEYSQLSVFDHKWESVELSEELKRVLGDLELVIEEKQADIKILDLPVIKGHRRQLQQLFQNLIGNSLKYSKEGIAPIIIISSLVTKGKDIHLNLPEGERESQFFHIRIIDNGIGFEQKNADKIFRVFHRLHERNEYQGTGVGLSIVKKVVENHSGYVTAQSQSGIGSIFNIYLPVK